MGRHACSDAPTRVSPAFDHRREIVTVASADLVGSATEVALMTTVAGDGTELGAT